LKDRYPELYKQIHPTKNQNINIDLLTYGSHKKLWWICQKAPCDHHIWLAAVKDRGKGNVAHFVQNIKHVYVNLSQQFIHIY
jgi:hypothetical protein